MIKIVTGSSVPIGSTIALVNLCNQFNSRGYNCILYGPDNWHMDKCASAQLYDFHPSHGDIIILNNIKLLSPSDLFNMHDKYRMFSDVNWFTSIRDLTLKLFYRTRPSDNMRLIFSCQGHDNVHVKALNYALFDKLHYLSVSQWNYHKINRPHFIAPNCIEELSISEQKPDKVAGIIGSIRRENDTASSVEQAVQGGMNTVIIYGYLLDPLYYYTEIESLTKKYPGKVKFAGFVENRQKMYDSISDVYCSISKPWSMVRKECISTNTRYHGPDSSNRGETTKNDQILKIWINELGL